MGRATHIRGLFVEATLEQPFDGIHWAAAIRQTGAQIPTIIVSAKEFEQVADAVQRCGLRTAAILSKPVDQRQLDEALLALSSPCDQPQTGFLQLGFGRGETLLTEARIVGRAEDLAGSLQTLTAELGSDASALIEFNSRQSTFCLKASVGLEAIPFEAIRHALFWSPVADVILRGQRIIEPDTDSAQHAARFEKMRVLAPFRSCAAIPVLADSSDPSGVFFFHQARYAFPTNTTYFLEKAQAILGRVLDHLLLREWAVKNQRHVLLGQMEVGLFHELRNLLQPLRRQSAFLKETLKEGNVGLFPKARQALVELVECNTEVQVLADRVLGTLRDPARGELDIRSLVDDVAATIFPTAKDKGVVIEKRLDVVPKVTSQPQRIVQVLLNLCLNAIAAMDGYPGARRLVLSLSHHANELDYPIHVEVSDSGPGIHVSEAGTIFEPGFTTKAGGTGLGLSISRHLAATIGGRLSLKRACRYAGAAFALEMPLVNHNRNPQ
jgi:signal transduction histidine kinase